MNSLLLVLSPISCQIPLVVIVLYGLIMQLADPKHTVPDEPPLSDLPTPLSPMWDLPLDDGDTHPAGILEVSALLS